MRLTFRVSFNKRVVSFGCTFFASVCRPFLPSAHLRGTPTRTLAHGRLNSSLVNPPTGSVNVASRAGRESTAWLERLSSTGPGRQAANGDLQELFCALALDEVGEAARSGV